MGHGPRRHYEGTMQASHMLSAPPAIVDQYFRLMLYHGPEMVAHDFRFYEFRLDAHELQTLAAEWPLHVCGNGIRQPDAGEWCDDGNAEDGDGCSAACMVEAGYVCRAGDVKSTMADSCFKGQYRANGQARAQGTAQSHETLCE